MSKKAAPAAKEAVSARGDETRARKVYRGIRLQPPVGKTRYSSEEIRRAIDAAIKKNPDAFAKRS